MESRKIESRLLRLLGDNFDLLREAVLAGRGKRVASSDDINRAVTVIEVVLEYFPELMNPKEDFARKYGETLAELERRGYFKEIPRKY